MLCKGYLCRFYKEHDYYKSYKTCLLEGKSFTNITERECVLSQYIEQLERLLKDLMDGCDMNGD